MKDLWVEKWRPNTTADYVFRDNDQKRQVDGWITSGGLPHLMFSGDPGTGKTTLAKVLLNELDVDSVDILEINASNENNVDTIRNKITNFASMMPFGDLKYVLLDECLDEDTLVVVKRGNAETLIKIKDLDSSIDLVKSYNVSAERVEWKTFTLFDKGIQDTVEIELDTGDVIICTLDHKWYVEDGGEIIVVKASELHRYNHIMSPIDK